MMNRRIVLTLLLGYSLPLLAQTTAPDPNRVALQALVNTFITTTNAKDAKGFSACFTEDGEFTNPVGTFVKGRTAIEAFHARLFSPTRFRSEEHTSELQ